MPHCGLCMIKRCCGNLTHGATQIEHACRARPKIQKFSAGWPQFLPPTSPATARLWAPTKRAPSRPQGPSDGHLADDREHGGRIIDTAGDGILAEFASVVNAVECAVAIQKTMAERNADVPADRRMQFRIGVNLGDVIHDERVSTAMASTSQRGSKASRSPAASASPVVHDHVQKKLSTRLLLTLASSSSRTSQQPVRVYRVSAGRTAPLPRLDRH